MSHISVQGEQSTSAEITLLTALNNLTPSASGFLRKTAVDNFIQVEKSDFGDITADNLTVANNVIIVGTIGTGVWQGTTIKANYLQQAAADLGDADINLNFSNTNTGNVTNLIIDGAYTGLTYNGLTLTAAATGFTIAGGATSKTLTVSLDASVSGTNTGDQTLPVKATGAELDTGTDDAKFATAKAIADSKLSYIDGAETLTNKRITKRAPTITQSATPTINTDLTDVAHIVGLAQDITSFTTNLSGTPVQGDTLRIDITDNGTARAITWGASFEASTVALPTTTVLSVRLDVGFVWNTVTSKWRCVATV